MIITVATLLPWLLVLLNRMSSHGSFFLHHRGLQQRQEKKRRKRRKEEEVERKKRDSKNEHDEMRKNAKMAAGLKRGEEREQRMRKEGMSERSLEADITKNDYRQRWYKEKENV